MSLAFSWKAYGVSSRMALGRPGPSRAVRALWMVTIVGLVSPEPMMTSTRVCGASLKADSSTLSAPAYGPLACWQAAGPLLAVLYCCPLTLNRQAPGLTATTRNLRSRIGQGHASAVCQASRSRGRNASRRYSGTAQPMILR